MLTHLSTLSHHHWVCRPGRGHRKQQRNSTPIKQVLFILCVCVCFPSTQNVLISCFFSFTLSLALPHTQGGIIDNHRVWGHGTGNQGCLGNGALLIKWSSSLSTCGSEVDRVLQLSLLFCSVFSSMFLFYSSLSKSQSGVCYSHSGNFDI